MKNKPHFNIPYKLGGLGYPFRNSLDFWSVKSLTLNFNKNLIRQFKDINSSYLNILVGKNSHKINLSYELELKYAYFKGYSNQFQIVEYPNNKEDSFYIKNIGLFINNKEYLNPKSSGRVILEHDKMLNQDTLKVTMDVIVLCRKQIIKSNEQVEKSFSHVFDDEWHFMKVQWKDTIDDSYLNSLYRLGSFNNVVKYLIMDKKSKEEIPIVLEDYI